MSDFGLKYGQSHTLYILESKETKRSNRLLLWENSPVVTRSKYNATFPHSFKGTSKLNFSQHFGLSPSHPPIFPSLDNAPKY